MLVDGFSKSFAMTGWRLGYACAPAPVMKPMVKLHQFALMCAPTTAQYAAVEAMENGDEDVERMPGGLRRAPPLYRGRAQQDGAHLL